MEAQNSFFFLNRDEPQRVEFLNSEEDQEVDLFNPELRPESCLSLADLSQIKLINLRPESETKPV